MKKYGFGADVGGTTIKMGLFEMDGTLVEKWEIPTDTTEKGAHILQDSAATVHGKMVENDLTKDMVEMCIRDRSQICHPQLIHNHVAAFIFQIRL